MNLTWRDAVETLLVAASVAVTVSVAYGWNLPLLGDARAGAIALLVLAYPSCLVAQAPGRLAAAIRHENDWGPFLVAGTLMGALALLLIVVGAILNSLAVLMATTIVVVAIWLVTTIHHMVEAGPGASLAGDVLSAG